VGRLPIHLVPADPLLLRLRGLDTLKSEWALVSPGYTYKRRTPYGGAGLTRRCIGPAVDTGGVRPHVWGRVEESPRQSDRPPDRKHRAERSGLRTRRQTPPPKAAGRAAHHQRSVGR